MTSAPRLAPFSRNCTPATPTLSDAAAEIVTVPVIVAPAVGFVMDTEGDVVSPHRKLLEDEGPIPVAALAPCMRTMRVMTVRW